jgi:hypothetical protein
MSLVSFIPFGIWYISYAKQWVKEMGHIFWQEELN